ncbi:MAG TPA: hypothetical protein VFQ38_23645 [Longimicrobiales bacterium]|nr:hypothetical protein [Longimicrobiales bacterium]
MKPPRIIDGERLSRVVDCGSGPAGPNADMYQGRLTVIGAVVPDPAASRIESHVEGHGPPVEYGGSGVACGSANNTALERLIAERVRMRWAR